MFVYVSILIVIFSPLVLVCVEPVQHIVSSTVDWNTSPKELGGIVPSLELLVSRKVQ